MNLLVVTLLVTISINTLTDAQYKHKRVRANSFQIEALNQHNLWRSKHGTPPLIFNARISRVAQEWAKHIATNEQPDQRPQHRPNSQYGENIYWIKTNRIDGKMPVDFWYNEIKDYDYSQPGFSPETGHFTQLIWLKSKYFGIGMAKSASGTIYVVANYSPKGNYLNEFEQNVLRPLADDNEDYDNELIWS